MKHYQYPRDHNYFHVATGNGYFTTYSYYLVVGFSLLHLFGLAPCFLMRVFTSLAIFVFITGSILNYLDAKNETLAEKLFNRSHLGTHLFPLLLIIAVRVIRSCVTTPTRFLDFLPVFACVFLIWSTYSIVYLGILKKDYYFEGNLKERVENRSNLIPLVGFAVLILLLSSMLS